MGLTPGCVRKIYRPAQLCSCGGMGRDGCADLHREEKQHAVPGAPGHAAVLAGLVSLQWGSSRSGYPETWLELLRNLQERQRQRHQSPVPPCCSSAFLDVRDRSCSTLTCAMVPMLSCPSSQCSYIGIQWGHPRTPFPSPMGFWHGDDPPMLTCGLSPFYELPKDVTLVPASPTSFGRGERLVTRMTHGEAGSAPAPGAKVTGEHRR